MEISENTDLRLKELAQSIGSSDPLNNFSIFYGDGGIYLALDALSKKFPANQSIAIYRQKFLENTLENLTSSDYPNLTFSIGCVGFMAGLIVSESEDYDYEELFKPIDRAMIGLVQEFRSKDHPYDPFKGILGSMNYLRFRKTVIGDEWEKCLNEVVAYFDQTKYPFFDGIIWLEDKRKDIQHEKEKAMLCNLGLAHGEMAILFWLGLAYKETKNPIALSLIKDAFKAIQAIAKDFNHPIVHYPSVINKDNTYNGSDIAWCYGDLSSAIVLNLLGEVTELEAIKIEAHQVALNAANNVLNLPIPDDSCLCHGLAGNAYMLNLLQERYPAEGAFGAARDRLLNDLLKADNQNESNTFKGYQNREFSYEKNEMERAPIKNMLNGDAGIALAILGMEDRNYRYWDRLMLMRY